MPVSTGSYGYGSYGSVAGSNVDSYGAVTSYVRPYYASSEKRETKVKPDGKTCQTPSTCPVCEDYINLDWIGRFCSLDGVYTVSQKDEHSTCVAAKIHDVLMGERKHNKKDIQISTRNGCSCPQLDSNDEVIVLTSRSKNISNGNLIADSEVYIVPKSQSVLADIADLKERCNSPF